MDLTGLLYDIVIHSVAPLTLAGVGGTIAFIRLQDAHKAHEKIDDLRFGHIAETLVDIKNTGKSTDEKVDRLVERLIPPAHR